MVAALPVRAAAAVTRVFVDRFGHMDRTQVEYREPDGGLRVEILGSKDFAPRVRAWLERASGAAAVVPTENARLSRIRTSPLPKRRTRS